MLKFVAIKDQTKKYKKRKDVPYIKKRKLKKIDEDGVVIGQTVLKKANDDDRKNNDIDILQNNEDMFIFNEHIFLGFKQGYIDVGNHQYIMLKKSPIILILFLVTVICFCSMNYYKDILQINNTGTNEVTEISKASGKDMRIVISSAIRSDGKKMENMNMKNMNKDRYLRYVFYKGGDEIYDSQLIEYNRTIQKDVLSKNIKKGNHDIKVKVVSYDLDKNVMGYHYVLIKMNVK